jgi:hypothetical protein
VASHEQLERQRSDDRYRPRLDQRASDLFDNVGSRQRSWPPAMTGARPRRRAVPDRHRDYGVVM